MFEEFWDMGLPAFTGLDQLRQDLNTLMGLPDGQNFFRSAAASGFPLVNVGETDQEVHVYALAPGLEAKDLDISLQGNRLNIHGTRQTEANNDKANRERNWYRQERFTGEFSKMVSLPESIDSENVEAKAENGVIHIKLPKSAETQPRKITVKAE